MNHTYIHGDVIAEPVLHYPPDDVPCVTLTVVVDASFPPIAEQDGQPSRCDVIAYGRLAENAALTVWPGMAVTVIGHPASSSDVAWTPSEWLEATDLAVSLGHATAEVTVQQRHPSAPVDLSGITPPW